MERTFCVERQQYNPNRNKEIISFFWIIIIFCMSWLYFDCQWLLLLLLPLFFFYFQLCLSNSTDCSPFFATLMRFSVSDNVHNDERLKWLIWCRSHCWIEIIKKWNNNNNNQMWRKERKMEKLKCDYPFLISGCANVRAFVTGSHYCQSLIEAKRSARRLLVSSYSSSSLWSDNDFHGISEFISIRTESQPNAFHHGNNISSAASNHTMGSIDFHYDVYCSHRYVSLYLPRS